MMTAIDFGCYAIRSAFRSPPEFRQLMLMTERSEYAVLPLRDVCREALMQRGIPHAECEDSIVVFGNRAEQVRWLSRKPSAPLFTDGHIPTNDAPARQILSILTQAMLPDVSEGSGLCCFTTPGGPEQSGNRDFLSHILRMQGLEPIPCSSTEAANLACGSDSCFTNIIVCMGTEVSRVSVCRYGAEVCAETIDVGSNWIDAELARQHRMQTWDDTGECYLDLNAVRDWKHDPQLHLLESPGERERTLSRLYRVVLDRIAQAVRRLINSAKVTAAVKEQRLAVLCAGGPTQILGFAEALTERFVEQETASRLLSVRVVDDPCTAVVRGLLIYGELERQQDRSSRDAA